MSRLMVNFQRQVMKAKIVGNIVVNLDFLPLCRMDSEHGSKPNLKPFTIPQVIAVTGYTDNSVDRWLRQGHLKFVQIQTTKIIAKDWLIDFYCTYGYTIAQMSKKHIELMRKFIDEQ